MAQHRSSVGEQPAKIMTGGMATASQQLPETMYGVRLAVNAGEDRIEAAVVRIYGPGAVWQDPEAFMTLVVLAGDVGDVLEQSGIDFGRALGHCGNYLNANHLH